MQAATGHGGVEYAGALRLRDARLWLDGEARGDIAWLGRLGPTVRRRGRVVCSEPLAALLGPGVGRPLALPYRQPWRLGTSKLTLSAAGSGPGSSLLWVDDERGRLLVATSARIDAIAGPEPADLPEADVILVDIRDADAARPAANSLVAALAALRLRAGSAGGWVGVDDFATALLVARVALDHGPVRFVGGFDALVRRLPPAWLERAERRGSRRRDVVHLCSTRRLASAPQADARLQVGGMPLDPTVRHLAMPLGASAAELDEMVQRSGAGTVLTVGGEAGDLAARWQTRGLAVVALVAQRQLALW